LYLHRNIQPIFLVLRNCACVVRLVPKNKNSNTRKMSEGPTFQSTFLQFCEDLEGTYPELSGSIAECKKIEDAEVQKRFSTIWRSHLAAIALRDASVFSREGIEILPGVPFSMALWNEVGETTHTAIWNYLSSLALLSAASDNDAEFWSEEEFKKGMEEMMRHLKEAGDAPVGGAGGASPFEGFGGIFEKLKDMAKMFEGAGKEGGPKMPEFKIPERMFKGHIARMARELAEEFKPEDFGLSPEMVDTSDPAKIFEYLQDIFTKKPEMLMSAAQRIAKKIQVKFQRGEIRREEIMSEIQELMKEFSENEAFSAIFGQLGDVLQMSAKATGNEGSERRRQVQERLRKKQAEKEAKKASQTGGASNAAAIAAAEAAAAALPQEESKKGSKKKR
jgi:hypothetical protein